VALRKGFWDRLRDKNKSPPTIRSHDPDTPRNEDTLYCQRITEIKTRWDWWTSGVITRDDVIICEGEYRYTPTRFTEIMRQHDPPEAFPVAKERLRRN
jgi:hypothetical protein